MSIERKNSAGLVKRGAAIAAGLVLFIAGGTYIASTSFVQARLANLKLIPEPERYTELYFNNSAHLPTLGTALNFSFTIHNATGQAKLYPYEIVLVGSTGAAAVLESGQANTAAGQNADIPVTVQVPAGTKNSQISVELPQQAQSIDFWLGKTQ